MGRKHLVLFQAQNDREDKTRLLPLEVSLVMLTIAFVQYLPFFLAKFTFALGSAEASWTDVLISSFASYLIAAVFFKLTNLDGIQVVGMFAIALVPSSLVSLTADVLVDDGDWFWNWFCLCVSISIGYFATYHHFWSDYSKLAKVKNKQKSKVNLNTKAHALFGVGLIAVAFFVPLGIVAVTVSTLLHAADWVLMTLAVLLTILVAQAVRCDLSELAAFVFVFIAAAISLSISSLAHTGELLYASASMAFVLYVQAHCINGIGIPATTLFAFAASAMGIWLGCDSLMGVCVALTLSVCAQTVPVICKRSMNYMLTGALSFKILEIKDAGSLPSGSMAQLACVS